MSIFRKRERGAAAVEFALIAIPLFSIALAIVEFGFIYNYRTQLVNSSMAGARHFSIHHDVNAAKQVVTNTVPGLPASAVRIQVDGANASSTNTCPAVEQRAKRTITVRIVTNQRLLTNFFNFAIPGGQVELNVRATAVCF